MPKDFEVQYTDVRGVKHIAIKFFADVSTALLIQAFAASGKYAPVSSQSTDGLHYIFKKGQARKGTILATVYSEKLVCKSILLEDTKENRELAKELEGLSEVSQAINTLVFRLCELKGQKCTETQIITQLKGELCRDYTLEEHKKGPFIKVRFKKPYPSRLLWDTANGLGWLMRRVERFLHILGEEWPPIAYVSLDGQNCKNIYIKDTAENRKLMEASGICPKKGTEPLAGGALVTPPKKRAEPEKSMLNLNPDALWGKLFFKFTVNVPLKTLQDQVQKEGTYSIGKEKTGLFRVFLKKSEEEIARIKTDTAEICKELYCDAKEEKLAQAAEFNRRLSESVCTLMQEEGKPEKPPELNELFDRETRDKMHNIGKTEYAKRKGSLTITLAKGGLYETQQALMSGGYVWKEAKKGVYTLSKEGVEKPAAIITATRYLKATVITVTFLNARESRELITNFIGNLTSRQKIKPPPMQIKQ